MGTSRLGAWSLYGLLMFVAGCNPAAVENANGLPGDGDRLMVSDPFDPASCTGLPISGDRWDELTGEGTMPLPEAKLAIRMHGSDAYQAQPTTGVAQVTYDVQPDQIDIDVAYGAAGDRMVWGIVILPDNPWSIRDWVSAYHERRGSNTEGLGEGTIDVTNHCLRTYGELIGTDGIKRDYAALARY
jgi:hypothetical protein